MPFRILSALPLCALALCAASNAYSANIATDFSIASNPNGPWTYYYEPAPGVQIPFTLAGNPANCGGLPCWSTGLAVPNFLYIAQNTTGATVHYGTVAVPNNTLWLDPESGGVAVSYTAPAAGVYNITGDFFGIDVTGNPHPVQILWNTTPIFSATIVHYGIDNPFQLSGTLKAGDTISFDVGTGSANCTYCFLSTGLRGTITPGVTSTLEPASISLAPLALFAMFLVRKRIHLARQR